MVQNVNKSFHQDIEEGLIEVILVNETFYPSVNITLQITLTESLSRWLKSIDVIGDFSKMLTFANLPRIPSISTKISKIIRK